MTQVNLVGTRDDAGPPRHRSPGPPGRWVLPALVLVAFGLRLAAIALTIGLQAPPEPGSDSQEYDTYAWNLAQGRGYRGLSPDVTDRDHPTAYRPPAVPIYYARIYATFGHSYAAAHIGDCVLAAATVALIYGIARRCFGRRSALIAAAYYAFYPLAIHFNIDLLSETHAALLVCLLVACCLRVKEARGAAWATVAGLALGALLLCKPGFVLLLPLLLPWAWVVCGGDRGLWLRVAPIPALAVATLIPWAVRNERVLGSPIPFSTMGGSLLLQSNNRLVVEDPALSGYGVWDADLPEYAEALRAPNDEVLRDATAKRLAVAWLRENPDTWFYLLRGKFLRFWLPWAASVGPVEWLVVVGPYALALAFFLGALVPVTRDFLRDRHPGLIMHALILSNLLTSLIFMGQHRYRFPVDCLLIIIASSGAVRAWDALRDRSHRGHLRAAVRAVARHRFAAAAAGVAVAALAAWWWADQGRIEAFRDRVCRDRMEVAARAAAAYQADHGRLPADLAELVPAYLPNVQALHCPKHSLSWVDYRMLKMRDPAGAAPAISYQLGRPDGPGGGAWITEADTHHFGAANRVALEPPASGRLPVPGRVVSNRGDELR